MKSNRHPSQTALALHAAGDLGFWRSLQLRAHLAGCDRCRATVEEYRASRQFAGTEGAELPAGLNWDRLAAEMTANIKLGVEAGQIVARRPASRPSLSWRAAFAMAGVTAIVTAGWFLQRPTNQRWSHQAHARIESRGVVAQASRAGLELTETAGGSLTLVTPRAENVMLTVNTEGTVANRYVDQATGQVTIQQLYVEQ
ncbi:MAG: hypothetical protein FJW40_13895 [Acidobacteria bacterium]|nr:hypothetical protein [Acidobacteriota bacterium]